MTMKVEKVEGNDDTDSDPLNIDVDKDRSDIKSHVCRCGKAYPRPIQLMEHIKSVHLQLKDYMCKECGSAVSSQSTLNVHLRRDHSNLEYDNENDIALKPLHVKLELNDQCSERADNKEKLDPPEVPLYSCEECGCGYGRKSSLNRHTRDIHGKKLTRRKNSKTVYDEYKDNEPNKCKCGKAFGRLEHLEKHIKSVHLKIRDCICDECGSAFTSTTNLKCHIKSVHHKIKDYKCSKCDSRFTNQSELKRHEAKDHTKLQVRRNNEKLETEFDEYKETEPNKCKCGKTFTRPDSFKKHVKDVHLKIRDWKCEDCGSNFTNNYSLKDHIKSFHQRDYKCSKCDSIFSRRYGLKKHEKNAHNIQSHGNVVDIEPRNHLCKTCGMAFSTKGNLNRHVKIAHSEMIGKSYAECDKSFSWSDHLNDHVKAVHLKIKDNNSQFGKDFPAK